MARPNPVGRAARQLNEDKPENVERFENDFRVAVAAYEAGTLSPQSPFFKLFRHDELHGAD